MNQESVRLKFPSGTEVTSDYVTECDLQNTGSECHLKLSTEKRTVVIYCVDTASAEQAALDIIQLIDDAKA